MHVQYIVMHNLRYRFYMYITRLKYTHYSIYHIQYNILKLHYKIIEHNTLQEIEYTSQDIEHTSQDYRIKQRLSRQSAL